VNGLAQAGMNSGILPIPLSGTINKNSTDSAMSLWDRKSSTPPIVTIEEKFSQDITLIPANKVDDIARAFSKGIGEYPSNAYIELHKKVVSLNGNTYDHLLDPKRYLV